MTEGFDTNFIKETTEQTPYESMAASHFFNQWCRINDSITPLFISRESWDARGGADTMIEEQEGIARKLYLPRDLQLWEMMDVIAAIDSDTFGHGSAKQHERADQIQELGESFRDTGVYLQEYAIESDDDLATVLADAFYSYGESLLTKKQRDDVVPEGSVLDEARKREIDAWLLGSAYEGRMRRLEEGASPEAIEKLRRKTLQGYFKALVSNKLRFQERAVAQITRVIEAPHRELKTSIFRRGVEHLITQIKEPQANDDIAEIVEEGGMIIEKQERHLYDALDIVGKRRELDILRESGDVDAVVKKEMEIVDSLQETVGSYVYSKKGGESPSEIVEKRTLNCVGASILAGGMLDELGIKYVHVDAPKHSLLFVLSSDNHVYWRDFAPGANSELNREVSNDQIANGGRVEEVIDFANDVNSTHKRLGVLNMSGRELEVNLLKPEVGFQYHLLHNIGLELSFAGRAHEALELYRYGLDIFPKSAKLHGGLGYAYYLLGSDSYDDAITYYEKAIALGPQNATYHGGLGRVFAAMGRFEKAAAQYQKAVAMNPDEPEYYKSLGDIYFETEQKDKAVGMYEEFMKKVGADHLGYETAESRVAEMRKPTLDWD